MSVTEVAVEKFIMNQITVTARRHTFTFVSNFEMQIYWQFGERKFEQKALIDGSTWISLFVTESAGAFVSAKFSLKTGELRRKCFIDPVVSGDDEAAVQEQTSIISKLKILTRLGDEPWLAVDLPIERASLWETQRRSNWRHK